MLSELLQFHPYLRSMPRPRPRTPARPSHHNLLQSPELLVSASSGWWPSVVCLEVDRSTHGAAASAAAGREVARSCRRGRAVVE